jgi:ankyrin repeat protein
MQGQKPDEKIDSISKACAYGDFDKLKAFIEADPSCVNQPDEQGYFPLQWAALNNRVVETNYLLNQAAAVNARDGTGQTALHWAAVRGSLPCVETLLRNGADPALADNRGYTPCHVAAQYGQTAVLYHMALKWGVDCDTTGAWAQLQAVAWSAHMRTRSGHSCGSSSRGQLTARGTAQLLAASASPCTLL